MTIYLFEKTGYKGSPRFIYDTETHRAIFGSGESVKFRAMRDDFHHSCDEDWFPNPIQLYVSDKKFKQAWGDRNPFEVESIVQKSLMAEMWGHI